MVVALRGALLAGSGAVGLRGVVSLLVGVAAGGLGIVAVGYLGALAALIVGRSATLSAGVDGDEGESCRDGCCYDDIGFHGFLCLKDEYLFVLFDLQYPIGVPQQVPNLAVSTKAGILPTKMVGRQTFSSRTTGLESPTSSRGMRK